MLVENLMLQLTATDIADDLPLFRAARRPAPEATPRPSPAEDLLREVRPDELSPREALELLYRLRATLKE